jgi:uncharacterized protein (TIGR00369 family)
VTARPRTLAEWQAFGRTGLPGHLGVTVHEVAPGKARLSLVLAPHHLAPNGYLHAGTLVSLADTACGYGCLASLPEGATGFTTLELKSNHVGTALDGTIEAHAESLHLGRTTQVWDAVVTHLGRKLAVFRCTQLVLGPK